MQQTLTGEKTEEQVTLEFHTLLKEKDVCDITIKAFQKVILDYYKAHAREFPWRETKNTYHIYISEVMLQQTQTSRVVEKYKQFIATFPTFSSLAHASTKELLATWQGLGYNRRALMLQRSAQIILDEFNGELPSDPEHLVRLPGIGPATAASVAAFAFNKPTVFIETNIRAVFIHFFFPGKKEVADSELLPLIEQAVLSKKAYTWYSALMDYGVMLKKKYPNPSRRSKHHTKQSQFKGSDRQVRGKILRILLKNKSTDAALTKQLAEPKERVDRILAGLEREGFIKRTRNVYTIQ